MRAAAHFSVESALSERCNGVSYYHYLCELLEKADWTALGKKMEELWKSVLKKNALTVSLHGSDAALDTLKKLLPGSAFAAEKRGEAKPYTEELTAPVNEAFIIDGGVNYDVLVWPMERRLERKVLARVMSYEYLWHNIREVGGAYGTGMVTQNDGTEYLYTYRDPHLKESYETFARAGRTGRPRLHREGHERVHRGCGSKAGHPAQAPGRGCVYRLQIFLRHHRRDDCRRAQEPVQCGCCRPQGRGGGPVGPDGEGREGGLRQQGGCGGRKELFDRWRPCKNTQRVSRRLCAEN